MEKFKNNDIYMYIEEIKNVCNTKKLRIELEQLLPKEYNSFVDKFMNNFNIELRKILNKYFENINDLLFEISNKKIDINTSDYNKPFKRSLISLDNDLRFSLKKSIINGEINDDNYLVRNKVFRFLDNMISRCYFFDKKIKGLLDNYIFENQNINFDFSLLSMFNIYKNNDDNSFYENIDGNQVFYGLLDKNIIKNNDNNYISIENKDHFILIKKYNNKENSKSIVYSNDMVSYVDLQNDNIILFKNNDNKIVDIKLNGETLSYVLNNIDEVKKEEMFNNIQTINPNFKNILIENIPNLSSNYNMFK